MAPQKKVRSSKKPKNKQKNHVRISNYIRISNLNKQGCCTRKRKCVRTKGKRGGGGGGGRPGGFPRGYPPYATYGDAVFPTEMKNPDWHTIRKQAAARQQIPSQPVPVVPSNVQTQTELGVALATTINPNTPISMGTNIGETEIVTPIRSILKRPRPDPPRPFIPRTTPTRGAGMTPTSNPVTSYMDQIARTNPDEPSFSFETPNRTNSNSSSFLSNVGHQMDDFIQAELSSPITTQAALDVSRSQRTPLPLPPGRSPYLPLPRPPIQPQPTISPIEHVLRSGTTIKGEHTTNSDGSFLNLLARSRRRRNESNRIIPVTADSIPEESDTEFA